MTHNPNETEQTMANERFYISSGRENKMYTLRHRYTEPVYSKNSSYGTAACVGSVVRDHYVCNLSTDKEKAALKAEEHIGREFGKPEFDLYDIVRGQAGMGFRPDDDILKFGKYAGQTIEMIKEIDPKYLVWVCDNFRSKKHERTILLIKKFMEQEIADRDEQNRIEEEKAAESKKEVAIQLEEVYTRLESHTNSQFCIDIAANMRKGELPRGRAFNIVIDIMGKEVGRRNSKKYNAECNRIEKILMSVKG